MTTHSGWRCTISLLFRRIGSLVLLAWASGACEMNDLDFSDFGCDVTGQGGSCPEPYDPDLSDLALITFVFETSGFTEDHREFYYGLIGTTERGDTVSRILVSAGTGTTDSYAPPGRGRWSYLGLVDGAWVAPAGLACSTPGPTRDLMLRAGTHTRVVFPLACTVGPTP